MEQKDHLLSALGSVLRWRKAIILITLAAVVVSSVVVLVVPVYYKSTSIFYAASPDMAMPERVFGTSSEAMEYYGEKADIDRILAIANSNELADYLIQEFGLMEHYKIKTSNPKAPYYVREKLRKRLKVQKNKFDAIELSIEDTDKELAARMANAARVKIDELAQRLIKESQAQVLKTYATSMEEKEAMLQVLSDTLQGLRERYGVFNTTTQSMQLSVLLAESDSKLSMNRAKLGYLQNISGVPRDTIVFLQAQVRAHEEETKSLSERIGRFNQGMAQVEVLSQQHEEAREQLGLDKERLKQIQIMYNSYFPTIHVVEPAAVPIIKSRPKRTLLVAASTLIALVFSVLGVLILELYRDVDWRELLKEPA
jgi:tyrosine-protein kinase Etk/Wzc